MRWLSHCVTSKAIEIINILKHVSLANDNPIFLLIFYIIVNTNFLLILSQKNGFFIKTSKR